MTTRSITRRTTDRSQTTDVHCDDGGPISAGFPSTGPYLLMAMSPQRPLESNEGNEDE
jgi:hypothetical protein